MDPIESRIRTFLQEQFPMPEQLPAAESLLDSGIIDSIGVLTLVTWLEQEFGFLVEDDEVLPENLDSVANLVAYVGTKLDAAAAAG